jgi:hypothetical protein
MWMVPPRPLGALGLPRRTTRISQQQNVELHDLAHVTAESATK